MVEAALEGNGDENEKRQQQHPLSVIGHCEDGQEGVHGEKCCPPPLLKGYNVGPKCQVLS